jgi:hypothetical protein
MATKGATKGRKFPSSLNGGEGQDNADHRVGETLPQNPEIADVDPADDERDLEPGDKDEAA